MSLNRFIKNYAEVAGKGRGPLARARPGVGSRINVRHADVFSFFLPALQPFPDKYRSGHDRGSAAGSDFMRLMKPRALADYVSWSGPQPVTLSA